MLPCSWGCSSRSQSSPFGGSTDCRPLSGHISGGRRRGLYRFLVAKVFGDQFPIECKEHTYQWAYDLCVAVHDGRNTSEARVIVIASLDQALACRDFHLQRRAAGILRSIKHWERSFTNIIRDRSHLDVRICHPVGEDNRSEGNPLHSWGRGK